MLWMESEVNKDLIVPLSSEPFERYISSYTVILILVDLKGSCSSSF